MARLIDAQYKQTGAAAPAMQKMKWQDLFNRQKFQAQDEAHIQKLIQTQEQQDLDAKAKKKESK